MIRMLGHRAGAFYSSLILANKPPLCWLAQKIGYVFRVIEQPLPIQCALERVFGLNPAYYDDCSGSRFFYIQGRQKHIYYHYATGGPLTTSSTRCCHSSAMVSVISY